METIDIPAYYSRPGIHGNPLLCLITGHPGSESAFPNLVSDAHSKHSIYRFFLWFSRYR